jgi:hypothetical protein
VFAFDIGSAITHTGTVHIKSSVRSGFALDVGSAITNVLEIKQ